jgi:hypothetical protein
MGDVVRLRSSARQSAKLVYTVEEARSCSASPAGSCTSWSVPEPFQRSASAGAGSSRGAVSTHGLQAPNGARDGLDSADPGGRVPGQLAGPRRATNAQRRCVPSERRAPSSLKSRQT